MYDLNIKGCHGQDGNWAKRIVWAFLCPKRWHDLTPAHSPTVRHCNSCDQFVHMVTSQDELEATDGRHCISIVDSNAQVLTGSRRAAPQ